MIVFHDGSSVNCKLYSSTSLGNHLVRFGFSANILDVYKRWNVRVNENSAIRSLARPVALKGACLAAASIVCEQGFWNHARRANHALRRLRGCHPSETFGRYGGEVGRLAPIALKKRRAVANETRPPKTSADGIRKKAKLSASTHPALSSAAGRGNKERYQVTLNAPICCAKRLRATCNRRLIVPNGAAKSRAISDSD